MEHREKIPTPAEIKKGLEEATGDIFAPFPPEKNGGQEEEKDGNEKNDENQG